MTVPEGALWGASTARAVENFPISGLRMPPAFIRAFARIKRAAAEVNRELGVHVRGAEVPPKTWRAIGAAAAEVEAGQHDAQFVVDVYQAGAGTSFNMNVNEVIANRALEILGRPRGDRETVDPNDHVNFGQSTNDTVPTAMRLAALELVPGVLRSLRGLAGALRDNAKKAGPGLLKSGRTHLQDAVPMRVEQEVRGWESVVRACAERIERAAEPLRALPIGGTAVGTGMNAHKKFAPMTCARLSRLAKTKVEPARDRFALIASMGDLAHLSSALRDAAVDVGKIASDVRLLSSGPFTGLAELKLPAVQPGSSIMPGKVNPSIPEMLNQVCFQVVGLDAAVSACAAAGQLELNVMMPVAAWDILHALTIFGNAVRVFTEKCVAGMEWDAERCRRYFEASAGLATVLNTRIGYQKAAELAKRAVKEKKSIVDVIRETKTLDKAELAKVLDPKKLTEPGT